MHVEVFDVGVNQDLPVIGFDGQRQLEIQEVNINIQRDQLEGEENIREQFAIENGAEERKEEFQSFNKYPSTIRKDKMNGSTQSENFISEEKQIEFIKPEVSIASEEKIENKSNSLQDNVNEFPDKEELSDNQVIEENESSKGKEDSKIGTSSIDCASIVVKVSEEKNQMKSPSEPLQSEDNQITKTDLLNLDSSSKDNKLVKAGQDSEDNTNSIKENLSSKSNNLGELKPPNEEFEDKEKPSTNIEHNLEVNHAASKPDNL